MITKTVTVSNEQGLHMRPAGALAKVVKEYPDCEVTLNVNDKSVNAKSPMQIMAACIKKGSYVKITCNGAEEEMVLDKIVAMFEDGFGE